MDVCSLGIFWLMIGVSCFEGSSMILDSRDESMFDDDIAESVAEHDKKTVVDEHYKCFVEYKADIYKYLREKEVIQKC